MFSITETVTPSRTGEDCRLKFVSALRMMQDCSELWIDSEPAYRDYFRANNIAQLLVSRQVDVLRVPRIKEKLTITTGVFGCAGAFGHRNTIIYDESGAPCYATWCVGAFVNLNTGRMSKIPAEVVNSLVIDAKYGMEYLDRKITVPAGESANYAPVEVLRDDIDYNRHMNNAQYARIAAELLPPSFEIKRFRVEYKIPAKLGETLHPQTLATENGCIYTRLKNKSGLSHAVLEFCDR
ncbi:medium-chain acyl-[acyl-carrier-protein] hydrolase [Ereboglobus sp. PH5-10]|uniref:acyl-[acyl-carrier-protein] thioesterase n=1 Tax=Ereboglobus sp. PH5-10 TaxID=2940629 RepID=UPI0024061B69|nr:acyl-ACP thioesterase domain-containing protein [Ereboglobus sp. PH5-10]MDF9828368.1 medium-chain acyl-[acyl-carrier-protein] hydrolase [Ereboglobus sp. PH5-10]